MIFCDGPQPIFGEIELNSYKKYRACQHEIKLEFLNKFSDIRINLCHKLEGFLELPVKPTEVVLGHVLGNLNGIKKGNMFHTKCVFMFLKFLEPDMK